MTFFGASSVEFAILLVLLAVLVFVVFVVAARLVAQLAAEWWRRRGLRNDMVIMGSRVITVAVIIVGALVAFAIALHSDNLAIVGIVGATIVASLGVQDVLKDYVSGYYVLLERHIEVGDRITIEGLTGTVTEVRMRVTLLRTGSGDEVVVPNSEFFAGPVTIHADKTSTPAATEIPEKARRGRRGRSGTGPGVGPQ